MNINGSCFTYVISSPYSRKQLLAGKYPAGIFHKEQKHVKLLEGPLHALAGRCYSVFAEIDVYKRQVIQSSSATTVMVVGFVNSGLMTLTKAIHVIMGANVGTTVTAWILSLSGIDSGNMIVQLFKPSSFTPILALAGIIFYLSLIHI